MEIKEYITKKTKLQLDFLTYITSDDNYEENFQVLLKELDEFNIKTDKNELMQFLILLNYVSFYHNRTKYLIDKTEQLLNTCKAEIQEYLTNSELFCIFKQNKRILLFLIEEKFLIIDNYISTYIMKSFQLKKYPNYFLNELQDFLNEKTISSIEEENEKLNVNINSENFEKNRKKGENESYLCELIREDNIDQFISYKSQNDISVNTEINHSIFETNMFGTRTTLIEYAAFYGSVQIFKYLYLNGAETKDIISFYSVHGFHPEIISFLEDNNYQFNIEKCIFESIKCFHNEMADYFINKYTDEKDKDFIYRTAIRFNNYYFFPNDEENLRKNFGFLCSSGNFYLVKYFLTNKNFNIDYEYFDKELSNCYIAVMRPLEASINANFVNIFKILINHQTMNLNEKNVFIGPVKENYQNALSLAIYNNNVEIVKILLEKNSDVNMSIYMRNRLLDKSIKNFIECPIILAIQCRCIEILKLLLAHPKINLNFEASILKSTSPKIVTKKPIIFNVIESNDIEILKLFLSNPKLNLNVYFYNYEENLRESNQSLLSYAFILNINIDIINLLLSCPSIDVNIKSIYKSMEKDKCDLNESYPIVDAIKMQNDNLLELLLNHPSIDVNIKFYENKNDIYLINIPLSLAITMKYLNGIKLLTNHQCIELNNKFIKQEKNCSRTSETNCLHLAVAFSSFDIVKYLFELPGIDVNLKSYGKATQRDLIVKQESTIFDFAIRFDKIDIIKYLLKSDRIDFNIKTRKTTITKDKFTLEESSNLMLAAASNNFEIFKIIFDCLIYEKHIDEDLENLLNITTNEQIKETINETIHKNKLNLGDLNSIDRDYQNCTNPLFNF